MTLREEASAGQDDNWETRTKRGGAGTGESEWPKGCGRWQCDSAQPLLTEALLGVFQFCGCLHCFAVERF